MARTSDLSPDFLTTLKSMLEEAYGEPFVEDWDHALGGVHFYVEEDGDPIAHASVVERFLETGGHRLRTGYVEADATRPDRRRRGIGSQLIDDLSDYVTHEFELGALGTGEFAFYERYGWERWRGLTSVRAETGELLRTPNEDGYVMILRTMRTPSDLDLSWQITCDWRTGDVW